MRNFTIKIFIVAIAGFLIGSVSFYFWKSRYVLPVPLEETKKESDLKSTEDASAKIAAGSQAEIIDYVEKNIDKLSGQPPISGSKWSAVRIWFIDDKNFYIDYKDSASNFRRILVSQIIGGKGAIYEVKGRFVPGENVWILKSGADISGATPVRLYEKNDQTGEWIIK